MTKTLTVSSAGQVTLPKEWLDKFSVSYLEATETKEGMLLKPTETYEEVVFDPPMPIEEALKEIRTYRKKHDGK